MITPGDDFPIHQTADPIATPTGGSNFYDRYFFNGYSEDGSSFFAVAMGFYPNLGVVDAAFSVQRDGIQHNVRASKSVVAMDRMCLEVGPIEIAVEVPLRRHRIRVDHDVIQATLEFDARCAAVQEPRFQQELGGGGVFDYTRMTQCGSWQGDIAVKGHTRSVAGCLGTRDRSWGIRPVGRISRPTGTIPQFFWIWAPLNFDQHSTLYHLNADRHGTAWNEAGATIPLLRDGDPLSRADVSWPRVSSRQRLRSGSRRIERLTITMERSVESGNEVAVIDLVPERHFYMSGLGYTHPEWGHGHPRGDLDIGYDTIDLSSAEDGGPLFAHVQSFCRAKWCQNHSVELGRGVIEQLFLGPFEPLGLTGFLDP